MSRVLLSILLVVFYQPAESYVTLKFEEGSPPSLTIADTHVAELRKKELSPFIASIALEQIDTDCTSTVPMSLSYNLVHKVHIMSWEWTKHPDKNRINKPVTVNNGGFPQDLVGYLALSNYAYQEIDNTLPEDTVDLNMQASQIHILQWANQIQTFNPETGSFEQKLVTFLTDLYLIHLSDSFFKVDLKAEPRGPLTLNRNPFPSYPFSGTRSDWLIRINKEICTLVLKPELSAKFYEGFKNYLKQPPLSSQAYLWESDSWSQMVENANFLTDLSYVDGVSIVLE